MHGLCGQSSAAKGHPEGPGPGEGDFERGVKDCTRGVRTPGLCSKMHRPEQTTLRRALSASSLFPGHVIFK